MKRCLTLLLSFLFVTMAGYAQEMPSLDELVDSGTEWLQTNVDEEVLRQLGVENSGQIRQLFESIQKQMQGEYVVDLAALREAARIALPRLEEHPETRPYAAWLRSRMAYFDVAEEFRLVIPPPKTKPGEPPRRAPNPTPEVQRTAWVKQVAKTPPPKEAAPQLVRLKEIFQTAGVPGELVWMAEVESSFNPAARSPAGAVGLYQLMPRTARSLGLALQPTDERLDPLKNAAAAARYLKRLHVRFKNWPLALAAYNAGEGTVQTLLRRHSAKTFDEISPRLPAETQMYVPRIQAVILRREGKVI